MTINTKQVYIPSFNAEEIFDLSERGLDIKVNYVGMIPFSLELIKLRSVEGFDERKIINKNVLDENGKPKVKYQSDSIINVKFKKKKANGQPYDVDVRGYDSLMTRLSSQLDNAKVKKEKYDKLLAESNNVKNNKKYQSKIEEYQAKIEKLQNKIKEIKSDKDNIIYQEWTAKQLREHLYVKGFDYNGEHFVFYKRTSSKSRQSQALFINDKLFGRMHKWSRMGLQFDDNVKYDGASLLAYESLVSSSITKTIKINPKNILVVDDQYNKFITPAIEVGNDLKPVFNENAEVINNLFDGQGLIDKSLLDSIDAGQHGMAQLRSHFFKCCSFNSNIQDFLKQYAKDNNKGNYYKYKLKDYFGNEILAKNVLLIVSISSLKFLKYAGKSKKEQADAYKNWCNKVKDDNFLFGIVKHEHESKLNGYSRLSYQMVNTLDIESVKDIEELCKFEVDYINALKQDKNDDTYIDYLKQTKTSTNSNEMFIELHKANKNIIHTDIYKNYRKNQIASYVKLVKKGKVRQASEYVTVVGNPYEMLLCAVDGFDGVSHTFDKPNQVYTKLYEFGRNYNILRNPHNAMHNFYNVENVENQLIDKYFNFTKNIMAINVIGSDINIRCNGMDQDGDVVLMFKSKIMNDLIDKTLSNHNYPLIVNKIESKPEPVFLNNKNFAEIDGKISKSQGWIGKITNQCQWLVSIYWNLINQQDEYDKRDKNKLLEELLSNIAIDVVLSNVAIDFAKKSVPVKVDGALQKIAKSESTKTYASYEKYIKVLQSKIDKLKNKKENDKTKKTIENKEYELKELKSDESNKNKKYLTTIDKPKFWGYVASGDYEMMEYNCPMDVLLNHISNIKDSKYRKGKGLKEFIINLTPEESKKEDRKQIEDIINEVTKYSNSRKNINGDENLNKEERYVAINNNVDLLVQKMKRKKINKATMHKLMLKIAESYESDNSKMKGIATQLLNALYINNDEMFIELIKKS